MNTCRSTGKFCLVISFLFVLSVYINNAQAASSDEINIRADTALASFKHEVAGAGAFLKKAKGVLVFPEIVKAGIGVGGEYGEGVLRINNRPVNYFSITGVSLGLQLGGQLRSIVLVFLDKKALDKFLASSGWDIGVDGSVAVVDAGVAKNINTTNIEDPVVAFVISNKGLMFNLTLEGSKIQKINATRESDNQ